MTILMFDIDGTLSLSQGAGTLALTRTFEQLYGIDNALKGMRFAGRSDSWIVPTALANQGRDCSADDLARFVDHYVPHLRDVLPQRNSRLCPGVRPLLEALTNEPGHPRPRHRQLPPRRRGQARPARHLALLRRRRLRRRPSRPHRPARRRTRAPPPTRHRRRRRRRHRRHQPRRRSRPRHRSQSRRRPNRLRPTRRPRRSRHHPRRPLRPRALPGGIAGVV